MSRVRTYLVGRDPCCDYRVADTTVSRLHAEVVLAADGRLYVTDRGSTGGTFVWDGATWARVRQAYVEPTGRIRFGAHELAAAKLTALRGVGASRGGDAGVQAAGAFLKPVTPAPDRVKRPERNPSTGDVVEKEERAAR